MTTDSGVPARPGARQAEAARAASYVFPTDTNHLRGDVRGRVVQLIDQTGAIAAGRFSGTTVVTAAMEAVLFEYPIRQGMIIETVARVVSTGRTRMRVRVEVFAEDVFAATQTRATMGYLTMIALDAVGHPTPVPPLRVETEAEWAAHAAAAQVREAALARVG